MACLDTFSISFKGKECLAAYIPDVLNGDNRELLIGSHSLNVALYDDDKGYVDKEAKEIDEQIYAFIDDEFFFLSLEKFIEKVKVFLG